MATPQLSAGCIKATYDTGDVSANPTVQIWDVKRIGQPNQAAGNERFRIVISDGVHFQQAMLATQQNSKVQDGSLVANCVVMLKKYICNTVQGKKIIIVLELDVVSPALPERLGNAVNIEQAAQQASQQAQQAQQPPAQQPQSFGQKQPAAAPQQQQQQQQQQQNSFNSSYNRPVSRSPISDKNVRAVEALNPYCSPWTIKVIVDSKGDMKTWNNARGSGNLFSVTLKDKTGCIRATAFKEDANRLYQELQVGQAYLITRGQIKPANRQYCDFHEYEITFARDTQVCPVDSGGDLRIEYNLVKLSGLEEKQPNDLVDICGIASDIGVVTDVVARKDSRTLKKRNITIVDDSNTSVELTLWGKTAEEFEPEAPGQAKHVVVIRKAKVSDWNGRSLSFSADSSIQKNVDLPEAHQTRSWWDTNGSNQSPKNLSSGDGGGGGARSRGPNTEDRKTFGQAKADGVDKSSGRNVAVYNNVATITLVKSDGTIAYPSCPETKKKMVEIGENQWRCEATGKEYPEPQWRYCLSMKADDYTGNTWMTAFDDQAKELLGMEAGDVQKLKQQSETDPEALHKYNAIFQEVNGRDFVFRLAVKEDTWQDEVRLKTSIIGLDQIDYAAESKLMLKNLAEQHGITA